MCSISCLICKPKPRAKSVYMVALSNEWILYTRRRTIAWWLCIVIKQDMSCAAPQRVRHRHQWGAACRLPERCVAGASSSNSSTPTSPFSTTCIRTAHLVSKVRHVCCVIRLKRAIYECDMTYPTSVTLGQITKMEFADSCTWSLCRGRPSSLSCLYVVWIHIAHVQLSDVIDRFFQGAV